MPAEVSSTTREATLNFLLREGKSSASELAVFIGISVQAMRRHLRALETAGLVEAFTSSYGPGRPLNLWQLTNEGQDSFQNGSEKLALDLLGSIENTLPREDFINLLNSQISDKALKYRTQIGTGNIKERLIKLLELRRGEGYFTECEISSNGGSWYMRAFHCSIRRVAEKYPIFCDQELRLIQEIFPDCLVERVQWRIEQDNHCGFNITPQRSNI